MLGLTRFYSSYPRYMDQFPFPQSSPSPLLLFEKSATYLTHPLAPLRAHSLLPEAKLVVILHDPVQRAYSWYQVGTS